MITVKIGRRGQITIPREIRRDMGLETGDSIAVIREADHVLLLPISTTLLDLRGSVPVSDVQDFDTIRSQVIAARGNRDAINES